MHRTLEEIRIGNDLVVIDEHDRIVAENRGDDETEVADGAVARETGRALVLAHADLLETAVDEAHLGITDDHDVEIHEMIGDGTHALGRLVLDARLGCDEQDDAIDADDVTQRLKATGQLTRLIDWSHVVVHDTAINRMR